jgi:peptide/nickel transport system permease protein
VSASAERTAAPRRRPPRGTGGRGSTVVVLLLIVLIGLAVGAAGLLDGAQRSVAGPLQPPSPAHPFGTDNLGRDLFAGVLHGMRTSLLIGLVVGVVSGAVGALVGAISGFSRPTVDDLLMRGTEIVQVVPRFFLAILVIALFGPGVDRVILLLAVTSWCPIARVVRAQSLLLRELAFVDAARAMGATTSWTLRRHVLPNVLPAVTVMVALNASAAVLIEAGLGFIGLNDPSVVSLGWMSQNAQGFLRAAWWMAAFPGAAIALVVVALNLVADELTARLDPHRGGGRWRRRRLAALASVDGGTLRARPSSGPPARR